MAHSGHRPEATFPICPERPPCWAREFCMSQGSLLRGLWLRQVQDATPGPGNSVPCAAQSLWVAQHAASWHHLGEF